MCWSNRRTRNRDDPVCISPDGSEKFFSAYRKVPFRPQHHKQINVLVETLAVTRQRNLAPQIALGSGMAAEFACRHCSCEGGSRMYITIYKNLNNKSTLRHVLWVTYANSSEVYRSA
jgi:hypothetical protein